MMRLSARALARHIMAALAGFTVALSTLPANAQEPACVIELFTSQGCSSCPKADKLLARMSAAGEAMVFSMPVDYWDYIGWKDTLALPAFTKRQKAYANARGDSHIYTPQAIINGQRHVIGSQEAEIKAACAASIGAKGPLVTLRTQESRLHVTVGAAPPEGRAAGTVWLIQVASQRAVAVTRGENAGRTLNYTNVVRGMVKLGEWNGAAMEFIATPEQIRDPEFDSIFVLVQAGAYRAPGAILAAVKGP